MSFAVLLGDADRRIGAAATFAMQALPRVVALIPAVDQGVFAFAPAMIGALREATGGDAAAFLTAVAAQIIASVVTVHGRIPPHDGGFA